MYRTFKGMINSFLRQGKSLLQVVRKYGYIGSSTLLAKGIICKGLRVLNCDVGEDS